MGSVRNWVLLKGREFVLMVVDDLIPYALCMTGLAVTSGLDGIGLATFSFMSNMRLGSPS